MVEGQHPDADLVEAGDAQLYALYDYAAFRAEHAAGPAGALELAEAIVRARAGGPAGALELTEAIVRARAGGPAADLDEARALVARLTAGA